VEEMVIERKEKGIEEKRGEKRGYRRRFLGRHA
jgi:hypothetical protein